jgi:hypothetical protein
MQCTFDKAAMRCLTFFRPPGIPFDKFMQIGQGARGFPSPAG